MGACFTEVDSQHAIGDDAPRYDGRVSESLYPAGLFRLSVAIVANQASFIVSQTVDASQNVAIRTTKTLWNSKLLAFNRLQPGCESDRGSC